VHFTTTLFGIDSKMFDTQSRAGYKEVVAGAAGTNCFSFASFYNVPQADPIDEQIIFRQEACSSPLVVILGVTTYSRRVDTIAVEATLQVASQPAAVAAKALLDTFFADTTANGFVYQLNGKGGYLALVHSARNDGSQAESSNDQAQTQGSAASENGLSGAVIAVIVICVLFIICAACIGCFICYNAAKKAKRGGLATQDGNQDATVEMENRPSEHDTRTQKRGVDVVDRWASTDSDP